MATIGIIPARGGSKRLPRKNILKLAGKELIGYTIEASLGACDRTFVTTESEVIADVARSFGAEVLKRPIGLAMDGCETDEVYLFTVRQLLAEERISREDVLVALAPTSPLRTAEHIRGALVTFSLLDAWTTVMSGYRDPYYHWKQDVLSGFLRPVVGLPSTVERRGKQEYPSEAWPIVQNGAVDICSVEKFLKEKRMSVDPIALYEMPYKDSIDIDDEADLAYAEYLMSNSND